MQHRHTLSTSLDKRLVSYAAGSFNAYEAVYGLQQIVALVPHYAADLESMYGKAGTGDARRAWGVAADLLSAMATVPATMESLIEFGFTQVIEVDHIIALGGRFSLAASPVLRRLDFRAAILGDLGPVMLTAVDHDQVAKPLLEAFQDELRSYDNHASKSVHDESEVRNFRDVVRNLDDVPTSFPMWDNRPMFLDEQKALIDYMAKSVGAEIVADALVDEPLGEFLLRGSGIISRSEFNGEPIFNVDQVSNDLLKKPVALICHQAGNAALNALKELGPTADVLDRLFAVEMAVERELAINVSAALSSTRALIIERALRGFVPSVTDITEVLKDGSSAQPFDFPDLATDD